MSELAPYVANYSLISVGTVPALGLCRRLSDCSVSTASNLEKIVMVAQDCFTDKGFTLFQPRLFENHSSAIARVKTKTFNFVPLAECGYYRLIVAEDTHYM